MKRIVTIQDISCVGKCSLTVALPVISAMGVEASILPTAVLSTHTAFSSFTFHDLACEIEPVAANWKHQGLGFDAIYTGYLGSFQQIQLMRQFIQDFRTPDNFVFVDPAMGDNGILYTGFDREFALEMAKLVSVADVCVPNITEACMMLGIPYCSDPDERFVKQLLQRLCDLGAKRAVLTGVSLDPGRLGVMELDQHTGQFFFYDTERVPASFHGTGDVFASTCVGALARGVSLEQSLIIAHDYTVECIRRTLADLSGPWYGVNFEQAIRYLLDRLDTALTNCGDLS